MNKRTILIIKIVAAIIMLQTLFYKFTGAQESIDLFTKLAGQNEALLRVSTGILELVTSILLFVPKQIWLGGLLTIGLMGGAIMAHFSKIGIEHNNDNGLLFGAAVVTFVFGLLVVFSERKNTPIVKNFFTT